MKEPNEKYFDFCRLFITSIEYHGSTSILALAKKAKLNTFKSHLAFPFFIYIAYTNSSSMSSSCDHVGLLKQHMLEIYPNTLLKSQHVGCYWEENTYLFRLMMSPHEYPKKIPRFVNQWWLQEVYMCVREEKNYSVF